MTEEDVSTQEESVFAEQEERSGSGPGFILGVIVGVIAGAAAATLFAPTSGEQVRQYMVEMASPGAGRSEPPGSDEGAAQDAEPEAPVDRMRAMLARVRARVQEATEEGQQAAQEAEEQGRARYEELTHQDERQD